jgi:hypothetical protein
MTPEQKRAEALAALQDTHGRKYHWRCVKPGCKHGAACDGDGPWVRVFDDESVESKLTSEPT